MTRSAAFVLLFLPLSAPGAAPQGAGDSPAPFDAGTAYETVVTSTRTARDLDDVPVRTYLISRLEIEASGAGDVADLLETVPGLRVMRDSRFGAGVQMQGLGSRHVLVLVDGQRLSGSAGGISDLSRLKLEDIAQVEIVKGASSALYGADAIGGVINLRTRRAGRPLEGQMELRGGNRGWLVGGSAATANERSFLRLSGDFRQDAAYRLEGVETATTGSAADDLHLALRGEHRFSSLLTVGAHGTFFDRNAQAVDAGVGRAVFDRREHRQSFSLGIAPTWKATEGATLGTTFQFSQTDDLLEQDQRGSDAMDQSQRQQNRLWQAGVQWEQVLGAHRWNVGAELLAEALDSPRLQGDGDRLRPALYVQDDWAITEGFALTPGLRWDHDSWFGSHLAPKLAARYDPWDRFTFRAQVGSGFRAPDFQELLLLFENPSIGYRVEGNPDLEPETSISTSAGFTWQASRMLSLDVSYFHHRLSDLITNLPIRSASPDEPTRYVYSNVDRAVSQGIETTVGIRPISRMRLELGYTFNPTRDLLAERPLSDRPLHRATLNAMWRHPAGTTFSARTEWVGPRTLFPLEGEDPIEASAYTQASVRMAQELTEGISLIAGVDNLFDAGDLHTLPIRPRALWAGVSARY